jgi:sugar phosphate isomerase/epimerase
MRPLLLLFGFLISTPCLFTQINSLPPIGIVANLEQDSLLAAAGYSFIVESVAKLISPENVSDQKFEVNLLHIKKLKTPVYAFNIFLPAKLKVVGPEVNEAAALAYAEKVFARCKRAGVRLIVWGSGGSRRLPDGFGKDAAIHQFTAIARKMAALAKKHQITLALENLNSSETNFINTVAEAMDIVKRVNHPNFKLCADIYHMLKENESPFILLSTKEYLVHCDLAEKENRTPPGTQGDDFREYFRALKSINYSGLVVLECRWKNFNEELRPAWLSLNRQLDEAWKK